MDFPILEYDSNPNAVIEPHKILHRQSVPERAVLCFFQDVINKVIKDHQVNIAYTFKSELGENPLYKFDFQGISIAFFHPGVGAPLAAGFLEEAIAIGCRKFIACGGSGVLDHSIGVGHLILPTSAVRDEGTSYHYLPPGREVQPDLEAVNAIKTALNNHQVPFLAAKTWTTDAFYRETQAKVQKRKSEGCLAVEMEAAAFFAVAKFRGVQMAQILYGGDDVSSPEWDHRGWQDRLSIREQVFWLAIEACTSF